MSLGPEDSGQVFQAALLVPGGFGVIVLDSEEYLDHQKDLIRATHDLPLRFMRFDECQSAIKALLLPEAHKLLGRLLTNLESKAVEWRTIPNPAAAWRGGLPRNCQ